MNSGKLLLFMIILVAAPAHALTLESATATDAWLGDPVNVTANCYNNATPITRVYVDISGQGIVLPSIDMAGQGIYTATIPGNYFDRKGSFTATITCIAEVNATASANFLISVLSSAIAVPDYVYAGDTLEIAFTPKRNDVPITSGLTFSIMLDNQVTSTTMPPVYDTQRGWLLRVSAPLDARTYTANVIANYLGKTISSSDAFDVRTPIDFRITNVDRTSVKSGDQVSIDIVASNRGSDIPVNNATLGVRFSSTAAAINSITKSGTSYNVRATAPDLSSGHYQINVDLTYNGTTYTQSRNMDYSSLLSGRFADDAGSPIISEIKLMKSGSTIYDLNSNSDGSFSAQIVPDYYDVEIHVPDALITLNGAGVSGSSLNYTKSNVQISGLLTSGVYIIKSGWSMNKAVLRLKYDASVFDNPSALSVFRCADWYNSRCNGMWEKVTPDVSSGTATFTTSGLGAFVVGTEEKIKVTLNFDKPKYPKHNIITITGSTSGYSKQIANVTVRLRIPGTYVDQTINSNENGVFSMEFLSPDSEGNLTMEVSGKKSPYIPYSGKQNIEIISIPSVSAVFPGSIQVDKENTTTQNIVIVNRGQKDITNLKIRLNLDDRYYRIGDYKKTINPDDEIQVPLTFYAFADDQATTKSATITIESAELKEEKVFGFTIRERQQQKATGITGFALAMPTLPSLDGDTTYTIIFAILAFSAALLLKRVKNYVSVSSTRQFFSGVPSGFSTASKTQTSAAAYLSEVKGYLRTKGV